MKTLIAPTEPASLKKLGRTSPVPEQYGVDVWWAVDDAIWGVQRKEYGDLVASARDGRLQRGVTDMGALDVGILLIEGPVTWTNDGYWMNPHVRWSRDEHVGVVLGCQVRGIWCVWTNNLPDTVATVKEMVEWSAKPDHRILDTRPKPKGDEWGRVSRRAFQLHMLQGLPGVGVGRAKAILDTVGFPLGWRVAKEELLAVPGLGRETVGRIWGAV